MGAHRPQAFKEGGESSGGRIALGRLLWAVDPDSELSHVGLDVAPRIAPPGGSCAETVPTCASSFMGMESGTGPLQGAFGPCWAWLFRPPFGRRLWPVFCRLVDGHLPGSLTAGKAVRRKRKAAVVVGLILFNPHRGRRWTPKGTPKRGMFGLSNQVDDTHILWRLPWFLQVAKWGVGCITKYALVGVRMVAGWR